MRDTTIEEDINSPDISGVLVDIDNLCTQVCSELLVESIRPAAEKYCKAKYDYLTAAAELIKLLPRDQ